MGRCNYSPKDQASPGADPLGKVGVTLPGKRLNRNCCWEWGKSRMSGTRWEGRKRFLRRPSCCECNAQTVARHHSESSVVDRTKRLVRHGGPWGRAAWDTSGAPPHIFTRLRPLPLAAPLGSLSPRRRCCKRPHGNASALMRHRNLEVWRC